MGTFRSTWEVSQDDERDGRFVLGYTLNPTDKSPKTVIANWKLSRNVVLRQNAINRDLFIRYTDDVLEDIVCRITKACVARQEKISVFGRNAIINEIVDQNADNENSVIGNSVIIDLDTCDFKKGMEQIKQAHEYAFDLLLFSRNLFSAASNFPNGLWQNIIKQCETHLIYDITIEEMDFYKSCSDIKQFLPQNQHYVMDNFGKYSVMVYN